MEELHMPHMSYRYGTVNYDGEILGKKIGWFFERTSTKAAVGYGNTENPTKMFVYYDDKVLGEKGNLILHLEGPDEEEVLSQVEKLERLLSVKTIEMTEEEEDEYLPNILAR